MLIILSGEWDWSQVFQGGTMFFYYWFNEVSMMVGANVDDIFVPEEKIYAASSSRSSKSDSSSKTR